MTTYSKIPEDTLRPVAAVESFLTAANPAITSIVLQQWDKIYNEFLCLHMAFLAQQMVTSTTPTTAHATTADDTSDKSSQQLPLAKVTTTLSCTPTTLLAHPTELEDMVHGSDQMTQQPNPTNATFDNLKLKMTMMMNTLPNLPSTGMPPIGFNTTYTNQLGFA